MRVNVSVYISMCVWLCVFRVIQHLKCARFAKGFCKVDIIYMGCGGGGSGPKSWPGPQLLLDSLVAHATTVVGPGPQHDVKNFPIFKG